MEKDNRKFKNMLSDNICYYSNPFDQYDYLKWLDKFECIDSTDNFEYKPLISIVMPTFNVEKYLTACIDSV